MVRVTGHDPARFFKLFLLREKCMPIPSHSRKLNSQLKDFTLFYIVRPLIVRVYIIYLSGKIR